MVKRSASDGSANSETPLTKYKYDKDTSDEQETKPKKPRTSTDAGASARTAAGTAAAGSSSAGKLAVEKTAEGDEFITLGKELRRVVVREYKDKTLIDFRDFYKDKSTGQAKPGKSGISLSPEQWELLKANMDVIDQMIEKK